MNPLRTFAFALLGTFAAAASVTCAASRDAGTEKGSSDTPREGWLSWRGPAQNGTSPETDLPEKVEVGGLLHRWSYPLQGRGTPVASGGRLFVFGYEGEGADLQEVLACLDAATGELQWEHRFNDFLSDLIYNRYSISSPTIDPETGNVFVATAPGLLNCFTADGQLVWQVSMMEELGRLTFPNGRTGSVVVDDDLVIMHIVNAHWGKVEGPAKDRFYAFEKDTGRCVWGSTPGPTPKDNPYSYPVLDWQDGQRVLYAGTGCGHIVCLNARTGKPLWRFPLATGGVNSSTLRYKDTVIALHDRENLDGSTIGRMVAVEVGATPKPGEPGPVVLPAAAEKWRNDLGAFTSSPVLVGDRVYQTDQHGELACVNADTGEVLWHHKLAPDQIHASPVYGDGKLYVPMNNGSFHIVRPEEEGAEVLCSVQLEGNGLGAPAIYRGNVYVHTTAKLYCFGSGSGESHPWPERPAAPPAGEAAQLQVVPADMLVTAGETLPLSLRFLDANGQLVRETEGRGEIQVKGKMSLSLTDNGQLQVASDTALGSGVLSVTADGLTGTSRVRVVAANAFDEDFESIELNKKRPDGTPVAMAPSQWIGVHPKWEVIELEGNQVLVKTLTNNLFQRAQGFLGREDMSGYTMSMDIMTDGNRRTMSSAGVVHQRYVIQLKGNYQTLEIVSNAERIKDSVPFRWKPDVWYTLKTRVDVAADGSGVVRAKAWKRDEAEPEAWTLEMPHKHAHASGAPGLFGFAPQNRFPVYVDNIRVIPHE